MFFAAIEFLFPKPIPFMRLGLANTPLILALQVFNFKEMMILTLIKVVGQGIINGTLASYVFLFSIAGSFASVLTMYFLKSRLKDKVSCIGLSIAGAALSNLVQTSLSLAIVFEKEAWMIIPYFLGIGMISSIIIGIFAERISRKSLWFKEIIKRKALQNES